MAFKHLKISNLQDRDNTTVRFLMRGVGSELTDLPAIGSDATVITGGAGEPPDGEAEPAVGADEDITDIICIQSHIEPHKTHQGLYFITAVFEALRTFPA